MVERILGPIIFGFLLIGAIAVIPSDAGELSLRLPKSFELYVYDGGHIRERRLIRVGDTSYEALKKLLNGHPNGWESDLNTYAPSLYFLSKNMSINCREDMVIVNVRKDNSNHWEQESSAITGCKSLVLATR